jgi:nucleotide-binding universal stress UspA family protein
MTVVVGVDGSPPSRTALRLAVQEARCRLVSLIAVSASEPPLGKPAGGYPVGALHTGDDERATTESALRDAVSKELGDQADQANLRVSEGLAGHVIVETARQTHAQLIVLAASPGKPMLPGTVSQYVLYKADCPVMLVPSSSRFAARSRPGWTGCAGRRSTPGWSSAWAPPGSSTACPSPSPAR